MLVKLTAEKKSFLLRMTTTIFFSLFQSNKELKLVYIVGRTLFQSSGQLSHPILYAYLRANVAMCHSKELKVEYLIKMFFRLNNKIGIYNFTIYTQKLY